jgi:hypothetical protein
VGKVSLDLSQDVGDADEDNAALGASALFVLQSVLPGQAIGSSISTRRSLGPHATWPIRYQEQGTFCFSKAIG